MLTGARILEKWGRHFPVHFCPRVGRCVRLMGFLQPEASALVVTGGCPEPFYLNRLEIPPELTSTRTRIPARLRSWGWLLLCVRCLNECLVLALLS